MLQPLGFSEPGGIAALGTQSTRGLGVVQSRMKTTLDRFRCDVEGTTALEYALIAALVVVAIIGTVTSLGDQLALMFQNVETEFKDAAKQ